MGLRASSDAYDCQAAESIPVLETKQRLSSVAGKTILGIPILLVGNNFMTTISPIVTYYEGQISSSFLLDV
jgi:hypothetical protein